MKQWILILGFLLAGNVTIAKDHPAFMPVKELFAAISAFDAEKMKASSTKDFQLLEQGEDWTMQMLIDLVMSKGKTYQRRNYFQQIRAVENGTSVWVSYWNKAEFNSEKGERTVIWLESAVMIKMGDQWKVQMLHSTRLDKEMYPKDIKWIEFTE